jgi:23S rRNA (cytosine1962-C5)-methyltransferase
MVQWHHMDSIQILTPNDWKEYELIDSGDGEKLERFGPPEGGYTLVRPDPRALWQKHLDPGIWEQADAAYSRINPKNGLWETRRPPPDPWQIHYDDLTFILKPTEFKHVGIFPEQSVNWRWLHSVINGKPVKVLNLFAYTGASTMAAAQAGAAVTHVDAVKSTITWANENVKASNLVEKPIRWIEEDAYKFVTREITRGNTYDGIIMDPPRFGRGTKGEVWKIEKDLPKLLLACRKILSPNPVFFLINAYTADLSSVVIGQMLKDYIKQTDGEYSFGELALKETGSDRILPNGIFARWSATS